MPDLKDLKDQKDRIVAILSDKFHLLISGNRYCITYCRELLIKVLNYAKVFAIDIPKNDVKQKNNIFGYSRAFIAHLVLIFCSRSPTKFMWKAAYVRFTVS